MTVTAQQVLALFGPDTELTRAQIDAYFPGETPRGVAKGVHATRRWTKRLRICRWIDSVPDKKFYPRAVYALDNGEPDAPKPLPLTGTQMAARWRRKQKQVSLNKYQHTVRTATPNSVFDLAPAAKRKKHAERINKS